MSSSKGILLIALGTPRYGNLAGMLAATIKADSPNTQICVVHSGNALTQLKKNVRGLFDFEVPAPDSFVEKGQFMLTKLYLDLLTPFDETLYLDVDTAWHYHVCMDDLFDYWGKSFANAGIQAQSYHYIKAPRYYRQNGRYTFWCNTNSTAVKLHKNLTQYWYCISSTLLWFKKDHPKCKAAFQKARALNAMRSQLQVEKISGKYPDEFFLSLGMCMAGVVQAKADWAPVYFPFIHSVLPKEIIQSNFYAVTPTGEKSKRAVEVYNSRVMDACQKLNLEPIMWQRK